MNSENSYSKKIIEHFRNPKNVGKLKNPDAVSEVQNEVCGDKVSISIKVGKNKKGEEIIQDIKFKTFGCVAAIASSSMVTELAKGKTLKDAKKISIKEISDSLGGLPSLKLHCSGIANAALKKAIETYEKNKS